MGRTPAGFYTTFLDARVCKPRIYLTVSDPQTFALHRSSGCWENAVALLSATDRIANDMQEKQGTEVRSDQERLVDVTQQAEPSRLVLCVERETYLSLLSESDRKIGRKQ